MRDIQEKTSLAIVALNTGSLATEMGAIDKYGLKQLKALRGSYKGKTEISHLIEFQSLQDLRSILALAGEYSQESILVLDPERNAELYYIGGGIESLGRFVNVTQDEALKQNAWTHCPILDAYYICR